MAFNAADGFGVQFGRTVQDAQVPVSPVGEFKDTLQIVATGFAAKVKKDRNIEKLWTIVHWMPFYHKIDSDFNSKLVSKTTSSDLTVGPGFCYHYAQMERERAVMERARQMIGCGAGRRGNPLAIGVTFACALVGLVLPVSAVLSPEELVRKQARSVHLKYSPTVDHATAAIGTVKVVETQTNSYYCILAWDGGYCGIQDKGNRGNILIFSVWDSGKTPDGKEDSRAKVIFAAPTVDVARFGGEGTGARTITPVGWKVGEPVTVKIEAAPEGEWRTAYTCFLKGASADEWIKIASISSSRSKRGLGRLYSFIEDFWRNYVSAGLPRRAEFSGIATRAADGSWMKVTQALFTADRTPSAAIDAGRVSDGVFFLQTGGSTTNVHAKLCSTISATP